MTTHADSLAIPHEVLTKPEFYSHVAESLKHLLEPSEPDHVCRNYVTILSNVASMLFGSFENAKWWGRKDGERVNWAGFYLHPALFPSTPPFSASTAPPVLLLGPFHGRPACLSVSLTPTPSRPVGVCAASFLSKSTQLVPDIDKREGHIACDGVTKSELVMPIIINEGGEEKCVGVLDLDCEKVEGFDENDVKGLKMVLEVVKSNVVWNL